MTVAKFIVAERECRSCLCSISDVHVSEIGERKDSQPRKDLGLGFQILSMP